MATFLSISYTIKKPYQSSAFIWYLKTYVNISYFSCCVSSIMLPVAQDVPFQPAEQVQTLGLVQLP